MTTRGPCIFGEVLFDCFPDGSRVLGGAPFNVAWHLQAFGARPQFVSRVGDDAAGAEVRRAMRDWGMDDSTLQHDPLLPTGEVAVTFEDGEPSYDIVRPAAWDAIEAVGPLHGELLYHGTLATRDERSRSALAALVQAHSGIVFVDVNLRPPWWDGAVLEAMLEAADWAKLNDDELHELGGDAADAEGFLRDFALDGVIVTRGAEGAVLVTASGASASVRPERTGEVIDTVGAGDAFTSVVLLGLLNAWPAEQTLERAQAFASRIVGQRGATVHDRDFYTSTMAGWHVGA